jgi:hypothetical protein
MAMEIQIMRRTGYAMKIKTPAEAAGHPFGHELERRTGFWSVGWLDFTGVTSAPLSRTDVSPAEPCAKKSFFPSRLRASLS